MRLGFVTLLGEAGVAEEWRAALAGHVRGGINAEIYNRAGQNVAATLPHLKSGLKGLAQVLKEVTDLAHTPATSNE
jgi:hypothetical protein